MLSSIDDTTVISGEFAGLGASKDAPSLESSSKTSSPYSTSAAAQNSKPSKTTSPKPAILVYRPFALYIYLLQLCFLHLWLDVFFALFFFILGYMLRSFARLTARCGGLHARCGGGHASLSPATVHERETVFKMPSSRWVSVEAGELTKGDFFDFNGKRCIVLKTSQQINNRKVLVMCCQIFRLECLYFCV
jgi:hypothetical protein